MRFPAKIPELSTFVVWVLGFTSANLLDARVVTTGTASAEKHSRQPLLVAVNEMAAAQNKGKQHGPEKHRRSVALVLVFLVGKFLTKHGHPQIREHMLSGSLLGKTDPSHLRVKFEPSPEFFLGRRLAKRRFTRRLTDGVSPQWAQCQGGAALTLKRAQTPIERHVQRTILLVEYE